MLGLSLGLRKDEIFGLDRDNIDFECRLVHVQRTYVREHDGHKLMPPKTKMSDRYIPLRKKSTEWLHELYIKRGKPARVVCVNYKGDRANPRTATDRWLPYLCKHDLPYVTMLNLRHSFATSCLMTGMEIRKVSHYLGHTTINTTAARYMRYKAEDVVDDFDKFVD
ncbi:site-specific integrase [Olegusella massiliensis]|uniref:site-specific integrase n=1 Tax=Olegusella massiliensis TaxID=1776381 RepID=UPI000837BB38|nr:tyrosine-type recombinase/integrase [Olegusella massiliensis]